MRAVVEFDGGNNSRFEEAINLLRYGQLVVAFPERIFPEIGLWIRQWQHDHSFAVQIDSPNFGTHRLLGGPEGNWYSVSRKAPGWAGLEQITLLDRSARSEMQLRFTTTWPRLFKLMAKSGCPWG